MLSAATLALAVSLLPAADPAPVDTAAADAPAAPAPRLRVAISTFPPFVFAEEPARGFSIALWERVAQDMGVQFDYVRTGGVVEKLDLLRKGGADVAIGGITATAEREHYVDFTHPTLQAGIGIATLRNAEPGFFDRWAGVLHRVRLSVLLGFLLLIVVAGHLIWWGERGRTSFHDSYIPGVFEGMYWAIVTASTVGYGDKVPVRWTGRVIAGLVIVFSLPLFAVFTAELSSALTMEATEQQLRGPEDLHRRVVGVVRDTESAVWAARQGLALAQYDKRENCFAALLSGEVEAVVDDEPSISWFVQHGGRGKARMLDDTFVQRDLAFAVPEGSPLRERLNRALLALEENGELERLRVTWFGRS